MISSGTSLGSLTRLRSEAIAFWPKDDWPKKQPLTRSP